MRTKSAPVGANETYGGGKRSGAVLNASQHTLQEANYGTKP